MGAMQRGEEIPFFDGGVKIWGWGVEVGRPGVPEERARGL